MNSISTGTFSSKRGLAKLIAWSLILMAVLGGFSLGYAFPEFYNPHQIDGLSDAVIQNSGLYQIMIVGILVTLVLDVVVSYGLFAYFQDEHRSIALTSGILRLVYTLIFGVATFYLLQNLLIDELSDRSIYANLDRFQTIWYSGLVIFGIHIVLTGLLMKWHRKIPKLLYYLTIIAGFSYSTIHLLKLLDPTMKFVNTLETVLALPMILGELGLAVWLVIRGGK